MFRNGHSTLADFKTTNWNQQKNHVKGKGQPQKHPRNAVEVFSDIVSVFHYYAMQKGHEIVPK